MLITRKNHCFYDFVYKLFDGKYTLPFTIVQMPYIDSNISQNTFYSAIKREFLTIARLTLFLDDFITKSKKLLHRVESQVLKSIKTKRALPEIILF